MLLAESDFSKKVNAISKEIGIDPDWLVTVMHLESKLNPQAVNPITKATGLIQFMPATAKSLGTTTDKLFVTPAIEQLDFVKKYFSPYKNKLKSLTDTYLTVFYPVAITKPDSFIFPAKVRDQNPTFKPYWVNGELTKGSIVKYVKNYYSKLTGIKIVGFSLPVLLIIALILFSNN